MSNDDEDDMADLFSFGYDATTGLPAPEAPLSSDAASSSATGSNLEAIKSSTDQPVDSLPSQTIDRIPSNDSFLDLLEAEVSGQTIMGYSKAELEGADQEILDWLEDEQKTLMLFTNDDVVYIEETDDSELPQQIADSIAEPPQPPAPPPKPLPPPPPEPEPIFNTFVEALQSPNASMAQIRKLSANQKIDATLRPNLWCRLVCGKSLSDVERSSLADSFQEWQDALLEQDETEVLTRESRWIHREAPILASRIVMALDEDLAQAEKDVRHVLLFHYHSATSIKVAAPDNSDEADEIIDEDAVTDPLIPPVACAILSAGVPAKVASVMLATIMPTFMPLLALTDTERLEAAKSLHKQFYLLACYHLPLLVLHLDRYMPGWHCPKRLDPVAEEEETATQKGRNLEAHGVVPQSWLISHLAGECNGTFMNPKWLLSLWDTILTSSNNSLRFFLALAVLEKHAESLLLLTGDDLVSELHRIMEFKEGTTNEGFSIEAEDETTEKEAEDWVEEWTNRAHSLFESTPNSVVAKLRVAEDNEIALALERRQKLAEEKLKAKMEAQAKAHREAVEVERERVADEARERLTRARLVAYYRNFNPEKEGNIDTIMKNYAGRFEVLDAKLKLKYGVGFNPALKPKTLPRTTQNLLATMGHGFGSRQDVQRPRNVQLENLRPQQVSLTVTVSEVLPSVCWSKEAAAARGVDALAAPNSPSANGLPPLKFYLVDSRYEAAAGLQGRFPTAAQMGPEVLLDPERIQQKEESFESLRSAVHICVMGEGYAALPSLYGHKVSPELEILMKEDESQTSNCALYFIKKGFPFVSILEGGFARAHAWLVRQGPNYNVDAESVLVDYNPTTSLFAQCETLFKEQQELANATTRERTQRSLQNLFDSSMTALTKSKLRFENLASELDTADVGQKMRSQVSKLFVKSEESPRATADQQQGTTPPGVPMFRNPFTKMQAVAPEQVEGTESSTSGIAESTIDLALEEAQTESKSTIDQPSTTPTTATESSMTNRLAGLGAALNMSLKSGSQPGGEQGVKAEQAPAASGTKLNPFARLGALVAETTRGTDEAKRNEPENAGLANRFGGGWNALRKTTLARIRSGTDNKAPIQETV
jgi:hypothetical protein